MRKKQKNDIPKESKYFDVMLFTNLLGDVMMTAKELGHSVKCTDPDLLRMFYSSTSD
jgi:hypothetical protein